MKNILIIVAFVIAFAGSALSQTIEDSSRRTIGYISSSGTVEDSSRRTLGYINSNGSIEDSSRRTLGYLGKNGTVEDSSRRTLGYISDSGTVENSSRIGEKRVERAFSIPVTNAAGKTASFVLYAPKTLIAKLRSDDLKVEMVLGESGEEEPQVVLPPELQDLAEVRRLKMN